MATQVKIYNSGAHSIEITSLENKESGDHAVVSTVSLPPEQETVLLVYKNRIIQIQEQE
jgi:hypothetical protein